MINQMRNKRFPKGKGKNKENWSYTWKYFVNNSILETNSKILLFLSDEQVTLWVVHPNKASFETEFKESNS